MIVQTTQANADGQGFPVALGKKYFHPPLEKPLDNHDIMGEGEKGIGDEAKPQKRKKKKKNINLIDCLYEYDTYDEDILIDNYMRFR